MFKRKPKKSHKSDEVFVDYSNEVDVKKNEEEEAIPEHFEALEVKDEVVVSKSQILQAKNIEAQNKRMDKIVKQQANLEEEQAQPLQTNDNENESNCDEENMEIPTEETIHHQEQVVSLKEKEVEDESMEDIDHVFDAYEAPVEKKNVSSNIPSFLQNEYVTSKREVEKVELQEEPNQDFEEEVGEETFVENGYNEKSISGKNDSKKNEESFDAEEEQARKRDLRSYFHKDPSVLKRGKNYRKKTIRPNEKKDRPVYSIKGHHFYSMDEFVSFLNTSYSNIEDLANAILQDEQFFRWLKDESIYFEDSIAKMKKFKQELKQ